MSDRLLRVSTASRLHFGMFSFGRPGVRQFGGVGAMVAAAGARLVFAAAQRLEVSGPSASRVAEFVERFARRANWLKAPLACRITVEQAPPEHVGLGSGTQLGMALALGLNAWFEGPWRTAAELAASVGRGRRSAVGVYGALLGALLIEGGKLADEELSPLVARIELPDAWRFVLFLPGGKQGLSGTAEERAFDALPPIEEEVTAALCRIALLELAPAAAGGDFERFGESLYQFGRLAGQCFAAQQGGPYADRRIESLVARLRAWGVRGVGQTSWGPTVFALVSGEAKARHLVDAWTNGHTADGGAPELLIAAPANRGAQIEFAAA